MSLRFVKMQALGNDFVIIDRTIDSTMDLSLSARRLLADRRLGIGCDQLLVIEKPASAQADFGYRIFNQDGTEVEQCGNGARCVGRYIFDQDKVASDSLTLACQAGLITVKASGEHIAVNMGIASMKPASVGFSGTLCQDRYHYDWEGACIELGVTSLGNPHAVCLVDEIDSNKLDAMGAQLNDKTTGLFAHGVNLGFMRIIDAHHIELAVYERGVGRTLACGSGACAAVIIGQQWGHLAESVQVDLPGGPLQVTRANGDAPIWLRGAANYVFHGELIT